MKRDHFKDFIEDQLSQMPNLSTRPMFGGIGLYQGDVFFGILHKGRLYFKTDFHTRPLYIDKGMSPFRPNKKQTLRSYYEVPVEVMEDRESLQSWALQAIRTVHQIKNA